MHRIRIVLATGFAGGLLGLPLGQAAANDCTPTTNCTDPGYPCSPSTRRVACNPTPSDNQVTLFEDVNYGGDCLTLEVSAGTPEFGLPSMSPYGFNDCISSVKTGRNVRLKAYLDDNYTSKYAIATYEAGASYPDSKANDSFSSLVATFVPGLTDREPMPFRYQGNYPHHGGFPWSMEAQGMAHDRTSWYITNEDWLPGFESSVASFVVPPTNVPDNCGLVSCFLASSGGATYTCTLFCFDPGVPVSNEFKDCIASPAGNHFTGRIYKTPLDEDLNALTPRTIVRELWQIHDAPNADLGYRHFGDPDTIVIDGATFIMVPVQGCGSPTRQLLPYVLVLDANLNYYAHFTLPQTVGFPKDSKQDPRLDTGAYVAVDPNSSRSALDFWMSGNIQNGQGVEVFRAELRPGGQQAAFVNPGPTLSRYPYAPTYTVNGDSVQGGVFSPSGRTFYLSRGTNHNFGGVHAFDARTGKELTETGNHYGLFDFQQENGIFDFQEPEGLDFFDTRCTSLAIPGNSGLGAGQSSQLHAILLDNGIHNDGDRVWLKHYAFAPEIQPMCDRWSSPWNQGFVDSTGVAYPEGFQVFALGDISGLQDAAGPIAAGGGVNLSSFSVNVARQQPVGIVAGGNLTLTNGSVGGAIYYGGSKNIAPTVTQNPTTVIQGAVIGFATAGTTLVQMSQSLRNRSPNGTVSVASGNITMTGSDRRLNVFQVSSDLLRNTTSIAIVVPAGSTVLIDVSGTNGSITNAGLNTNGQDSRKILWNFSDAATVTISSVGFRGSVLAPNAAFTMNWGSMQGTIVAKTVSSTAEMYFYPFLFSGLDQ